MPATLQLMSDMLTLLHNGLTQWDTQVPKRQLSEFIPLGALNVSYTGLSRLADTYYVLEA